jgi:hypothetical protein
MNKLSPVFDNAPQQKRPLPSWQDWLLLAISTAFVVIGIVILPSKFDVGITTLAFFGSCLAIFASKIWRIFRVRNIPQGQVRVSGGVPIRSRRWVPYALGLWLVFLGLILLAFSTDNPWFIRGLYAVIAVAGIVLISATALGKAHTGFLQFDPEGLTIGNRQWRAQMPWDSIASINEMDYHGNPVLLVSLDDASHAIVTPMDKRPLVRATMLRNARMMGGHVAIMTVHYGIDAPVLSAAIVGYVRDPSARGSLARRLPLTQG